MVIVLYNFYILFFFFENIVFKSYRIRFFRILYDFCIIEFEYEMCLILHVAVPRLLHSPVRTASSCMKLIFIWATVLDPLLRKCVVDQTVR